MANNMKKQGVNVRATLGAGEEEEEEGTCDQSVCGQFF